MEIQFAVPNLLAVLVSFVLYMGLGGFWYSNALFGKAWAASLNIKMEEIDAKEGMRSMMLGMIPTLLSVFFLGLLLRSVGADSLGEILLVANIAAVGLLGMGYMNFVFFERKPWKHYFITAGYPLVGYNLAGIVFSLLG